MRRVIYRQYLGPEWDEVRAASYLATATAEQILAITATRFDYAVAMGISRREIGHNRLDNPYARTHARDTILAEARKRNAAVRGRTIRARVSRRNWNIRQQERKALQAAAKVAAALAAKSRKAAA